MITSKYYNEKIIGTERNFLIEEEFYISSKFEEYNGNLNVQYIILKSLSNIKCN